MANAEKLYFIEKIIFKSRMSKFSFCKLIAWILIVFHCGLFSVNVVLVIGKCKFISTIHIYLVFFCLGMVSIIIDMLIIEVHFRLWSLM
jgi:hypothetical protein